MSDARTIVIPPIAGQPPKRLAVGLQWNDKPDRTMDETGALDTAYRPAGMERQLEYAPGKTTLFQTLKRLFIKQGGKDDETAGRDTGSRARDLDLHCFIFDAQEQFVLEIGPLPEKLIDPLGVVFHSGDEQTGEGVFDDETVRIEAGRLPSEYAHFFFVVQCDSGLDFNACGNINVHLYNPQTEEDYLASHFVHEAETKYSSFVFCHLKHSDGLWQISPIEEFGAYRDDWQNKLASYFSADNK